MRWTILGLLVCTAGARADVSAPPAGDAADSPFATHALAGPFDSLERWCAGEKPCVCHRPTIVRDGPFIVACVVSRDGGDDERLAVQTARGWFVDEEQRLRDDQEKDGELLPPAQRLSLHGDRIVVEHAYDTGVVFDWSKEEFPARLSFVVVCGVGPSGAPSCSGEIEIASRYEYRRMRKYDFRARWTLTRDGIALVPARGALSPALAGAHRLRFP